MVMTKWCHSGSMPDWNPTRLMYKTAPSSEVGGFSWYFLFIATLISFIIKAVSLIMKMADYCILSWAKWRTKCLSCTQPCTEPALFIFFFVKAALSLLHSKALRGWVWGFVFSSREGGQARHPLSDGYAPVTWTALGRANWYAWTPLQVDVYSSAKAKQLKRVAPPSAWAFQTDKHLYPSHETYIFQP